MFVNANEEDKSSVEQSIEEKSDAQQVQFDSNQNQILNSSLSSNESFDAIEQITVDSQVDRKEFVFVDTAVEGYETLLEGINNNAEVFLLDSTKDGVEQIADFLNRKSDIDAVHIVSYGNQAELLLGTSSLNIDTMNEEYADELALINRVLNENADLLIYGCNFGQGELGQVTVNRLAMLTGADVAASEDITGAKLLGGDWDLELQIGNIESSVIINDQAQQEFSGVLDIATGLVGHYKLDEGSDITAIDSSVNGNDGTHFGTPTPIHSTGSIDGALSFSDDFDRVEIADPLDGSLDFDANNFSVSFWFNSNPISDTTARLVGKLSINPGPGFVFLCRFIW